MLRGPGKSTGTKILLDAMSKDKIHLARFVLDALDGEIVDSKTASAQTPLMWSVLLPEGSARCRFVELLLQRGAGVNRRDADGRTALSYACEKGYLDAVKILVRNNADPEVVDSWGNSALMYAAVAGHSEVVEFLVRAFKRLGLQINRQNKVGNSAVGVAKMLGHSECLFALTSKKNRDGEEKRGSGFCARSPDGGDRSEKVDVFIGDSKSKKLTSVDSSEEFERSSPEEELDFSGLHAHHRTSKQTSDRLTNSHNHLRQKSTFFSPRPNRSAPTPRAPSSLGILLTPILAKKSAGDSGTEKSKLPDFNRRTVHDSYYEKRWSLPSTILCPAPPERTVPVRKSRTVRRREASPCAVEPLPENPVTSANTFSVLLSNKILRKFTSPECKKDEKELEEEAPFVTSGRIPRSETFPQSAKQHHLQVGSKPSIDSISSVKCEFDFHFKTPNF